MIFEIICKLVNSLHALFIEQITLQVLKKLL